METVVTMMRGDVQMYAPLNFRMNLYSYNGNLKLIPLKGDNHD